ncbi:hypothetical protein [Streptomyces sp. NPDC000851]
MSIIATSGVSASTPAVQERRDSDSAATERIDRHVGQIMAALSAPTPTEVLQALAAEHGLQMEEWDTDTLDEEYRGKFFAFYVETADRKVIVVPAGQDPTHRLAAVRTLLAHLGVTA